MIEKISDTELQIYESIVHPISACEILFSNLGNLSEFDLDKTSEVRKYQYHYLSYDTLFFENKELSKKQNFQIRNGLAEAYILGGRLTGKSIIGLIVDCLLALINNTFQKGSVSSADAEKIKKVMEQMFVALEYHPIFKLFNVRVKRNPYQALVPNGTCLESVNNNISGKAPGNNWHGRHDQKNWEEESSYLTSKVTHEKLMAQSEDGCINHYTGMTVFSKESPMGKVFNDYRNKNKIVNYPSYINPTWDERKEDAAIREFGGKNSVGFEVQILGKIIENGESVYDIERIRETYITDKEGIPVPIKSFEINKNNFYNYKDNLVIDRPKNAEKIVVAVDIGEGGAPSEYIVLSQISGIYKYIYNITTFKLSPEEEKELSKYIIETLKANIFGIDVTSGVGKAVLSYLITFYPENIIPVAFNEKIDIDFERDDMGNIIYDNNIPQYKQEYIVDWSIQRLKHIFYTKKIKCFVDMKLDSQFDNIVVMRSGQRTVYGSKVANHLHQAFQVFSIVDWQIEFKNIKPIQKRTPVLGLFENI